MNQLFTPTQTALDPKYSLVRDDPRFQEQKLYIEHLWTLFSPYADPNFKSELASQFHPRFWEMYLACTFIEMGFELTPRKSSFCPDIHIKHNGKNIWIEATAPDGGKGADGLTMPDDSSLGFFRVPEEQIILRLTNSIYSKCQQYNEYLSAGIISSDDIFILAINGFNIPYAFSDDEIPYIVKSVLPFGDLTVTIDIENMKPIKQFYQYREHIEKKSKSRVSTKTFQDSSYSFMSGIIYSITDLWNLPNDIGSDFLFVHNPITSQKMENQWLRKGKSFWVEDNQLRFSENRA